MGRSSTQVIILNDINVFDIHFVFSFNSMCNGSKRTVPQLKTQWSIIKMNCKKEDGKIRTEIIKTGRDPLDSPGMVVAEEDVRSWLPTQTVIKANESDSDRV